MITASDMKELIHFFRWISLAMSSFTVPTLYKVIKMNEKESHKGVLQQTVFKISLKR